MELQNSNLYSMYIKSKIKMKTKQIKVFNPVIKKTITGMSAHIASDKWWEPQQRL